LRLRFIGAVACSLAFALIGASQALANGSGGVAAGSTGTAPAAPTPAKPKLHLSPITSHSANIAYHGPVYVKNATGEVIPYTPSAAGTPAAPAATGTAAAVSTGGSAVTPATSTTTVPLTSTVAPAPKPELLVPGSLARYVDGLAAAPMNAPAVIQQVIWAANEIIGLPYVFGGGHASFISAGYDCSGTVSFALHGGRLLSTPMDSSEFETWGSHGAGRWIAIFSNPGHAYMTVAGLRLDTSSADDPSNQQGPRWRPLRPANEGFVVRHPLGL
jgi:cell wall-associated NlpC family hydrolase